MDDGGSKGLVEKLVFGWDEKFLFFDGIFLLDIIELLLMDSMDWEDTDFEEFRYVVKK